MLLTDSVEEITRLLHRAYARSAKAGLRFLAAHQTLDVTAERMAAGLTFVGEVEGVLAGIITLKLRDDIPYGDYYPDHPLASFGQFAVDPPFQGHGLGDALLQAVEDAARTLDAIELALDTAQPAGGLIAHYEARGFRIVGRADWRPVTNYESWIMAKPL